MRPSSHNSPLPSIESFPIRDLFNLDYTGRLEKTLSDIEKGKFKKEEFLDHIFNFTRDGVKKIIEDKDRIIVDINDKEESKGKEGVEILGKCPQCGHSIIEGKRGFGCSNWKNGCQFVIKYS